MGRFELMGFPCLFLFLLSCFIAFMEDFLSTILGLLFFLVMIFLQFFFCPKKKEINDGFPQTYTATQKVYFMP